MRPHDPEELLRAAFRDLHGARLHGFAILASLGDRRIAGAAARDALAAGARQADELRHPERAAAWLRKAALHRLGRLRSARPSVVERETALRAIGAGEAAIRGLASLSAIERAAIIAADIERLDPGDVQLILGTDARRTRRIIRRARERYLAAAAANADVVRATRGPVTAAIDEMASRTMGRGWSR